MQNISQQAYTSLRMRGLCFLLFFGVITALFAACGNSTTISKPRSSALTPRAAATNTARAPVFSKPITYVALGASDAVGVGSSEPGAQGYVPLIATHLPQGSHMLNLGISGIRLHEALDEELPLALNTSPQLITIWLVTNDFVDGISYQNYISDLNNLLDQLHAKTQARIVMANLPDLTRLPAFSSETSDQKTRLLQAVEQWDQGIAQAATHYGVTLINLLQDGSEITAHPDYISGDGFHPSAQGYVHLAALFWQAIQTT
ncbi:MAG TPA: GDSL-type esterase/lipase family protein [Ktedonobacteraceae bacterium]|nr:GDSL-type esterase/lipase family protein [Ktedonobacteraceae bacterium]